MMEWWNNGILRFKKGIYPDFNPPDTYSKRRHSANLQSSMNKAVSVEAYILSCLAAFFRRFDAMVYFAHRRF
jgi:hypothetical protein